MQRCGPGGQVWCRGAGPATAPHTKLCGTPRSHAFLPRVNVVPFEMYAVPEGQQLKEGSRKSRRLAAIAEARAAVEAQ